MIHLCNRRCYRVAAFNLRRTHRFLDSVAYAVAAQSHTKLVWQPYKDSTILNAIYSIYPDAAPGTAEIDQNVRAIDIRRSELVRQYWQVALTRLQQGPRSFVTYLEQMDDIRQYSLDALRDTFRQAAEINSAISDYTHTCIVRLAAIKALSTMYIAVYTGAVSLAGGAAIVGHISTAYSILSTFATDLASAKDADMIAVDVGQTVARDRAEELSEGASEKIKQRAEKRVADEEPLIAAAEAKIKDLSFQIRNKISSKKLAKLNRQIGRAKADRVTIQSAAAIDRRLGQFGHALGQTFTIAFMVHDVMEALDDFRKDIGAAVEHAHH